MFDYILDIRNLNNGIHNKRDELFEEYIENKYSDFKFRTMEDRLYQLYEDIDSIEQQIDEVENRILHIRQEKLTADNIYQFLLYFDKMYDSLTDAEKKEFLNCFVESIDIFEQEQPDGRFLKHIKFRFPVFYDGKEMTELSWDKDTTVETVAKLTRV